MAASGATTIPFLETLAPGVPHTASAKEQTKRHEEHTHGNRRHGVVDGG
jgi:hypothetical protein